MVRLGFASSLLVFAAPAFAGQPPGEVDLPKPFATKSATKFSRVIGWPEGKTPTAPAGFELTRFVDDIESPRWIYVLPNGDVLISQANGMPPRTGDFAKKKTQPDQAKVKRGGKPDRSS